ncbi:MAG: hypothetical protein WC325_10050 [Candidatus Bathyarchaeia archaeon]
MFKVNSKKPFSLVGENLDGLAPSVCLKIVGGMRTAKQGFVRVKQ